MKREIKRLTPFQLLAAEIYGYTYRNYADHIAVSNVRYTKLMPQQVKKLRKAISEGWTKERIASQLEIPLNDVEDWIQGYQDGLKIVFAENASESFRIGVKQSVKRAVSERLNTEQDIDNLVIQVCYRAADFGYLLNCEKKSLSSYYNWLTREKGVDYSSLGIPNIE
jgi:hypothetical protein